MRLVFVWPLALAACSFEHASPASGGGSGSDDITLDAPVVVIADAPATAVDAKPPPCPDDDGDSVCNTVDDWPCGAKPTEPPAMLTWTRNNGDTTIAIKNVSLDGTGRLAVGTPSESLSLRLDYDITDTACAGNCVDQLEIGWMPTGTRLGCIFDNGVSKQNGASGTVMVTIQARSTKQAYDLRIELGQNFSCGYQGATSWWDNQTPAVTHTIAKLCVH
jgi:hypothetical protein